MLYRCILALARRNKGKEPTRARCEGWDENYADVEKREPIFSGTAYEYIEKFGKEQ